MKLCLPTTTITIDQRRQKGFPCFAQSRQILVLLVQCSQADFIIPMFLQSQAPVAPAAVTFTATFMAR